MNKPLLFNFLISLLFTINTFAGDTLRYLTFGNENDNIGKDIILTNDRGYIIVGSTFVSEEKKSDAYIIKLDSNFQKVWSFAYGGNNIDGATSITASKDNEYIIAGHSNSFGDSGYDIYLLCIDTSGALLWEKNIGGPDWDFAYDIIKTYDENYILCGETYSYGNGGNDAYLIKINDSGDTLWSKTYGKSSFDIARSLIETKDSSIFICGETNTLGPDSIDILLWKLDKSHDFDTVYEIGGSRTEKAYDIIQVSDENIVFAGSSNNLHTRADLNQYLLKTDLFGNKIWDFQGANASDTDINLDDEYFSLAENNLTLILAAGYTKTYGYYLSKDISMSHTDAAGFWRGGKNYGLEQEDQLEKVICNENYNIVLGNTKSYGNGNMDIFIAYNFTDLSTDIEIDFLTPYKDTFVVSNYDILKIDENIITVFPNPFNDEINIHFIESYSGKINVIDMFGKTILTFNISNLKNFKTIFNELAPGIYFINIENLKQNKKIIKF